MAFIRTPVTMEDVGLSIVHAISTDMMTYEDFIQFLHELDRELSDWDFTVAVYEWAKSLLEAEGMI